MIIVDVDDKQEKNTIIGTQIGIFSFIHIIKFKKLSYNAFRTMIISGRDNLSSDSFQQYSFQSKCLLIRKGKSLVLLNDFKHSLSNGELHNSILT